MATLRMVLIGLCLAVFSGVAYLSALWLRPGAALSRGLAWLFCRTLLLLLRVCVEVTGSHRAGAAPRLVVANHVSWMDILVLSCAEPLCFLAKDDVARWPLIGAVARSQGTVFVDRVRRRTILRANADMAERLAHGRSVALFPEGTTLDGTARGKFLTSHLACLRERFKAELGLQTCLVHPVGLSYSDPAAAWVGDATLVPHLWEILRRPPIQCRLIYGAPLAVGRGYDRKTLGASLRARVDALLSPARAGAAHRAAAPSLQPQAFP